MRGGEGRERGRSRGWGGGGERERERTHPPTFWGVCISQVIGRTVRPVYTVITDGSLSPSLYGN